MKINDKKIEKLLQKMQKYGYQRKGRAGLPSKRELSRRTGIHFTTIQMIFAGQCYRCDAKSVLKFLFCLRIKNIYDLPFDDEGQKLINEGKKIIKLANVSCLAAQKRKNRNETKPKS